ncbi:MAG: aminotransferase class V-fold PLP-dependent enzyme [Ignavibacteria bacterium]
MESLTQKQKKNTVRVKIQSDDYFRVFRDNVIGYNTEFDTPYGTKKIIYADWTASGRLYGPIEEKLSKKFGTFIGNTHTETNVTGTVMTLSYLKAKQIIKQHVNANENDAIIGTGSGMTGAMLKLQRMLGFKVPSRLRQYVKIPNEERPIVFITHMEHHSNQTTWLETIADVEIIKPDENGLVDTGNLIELLSKYKERKIKIASITSCSNVTGVFAPYHKIAEIMHSNNGWCFVDFACSAPYIDINMHPANPLEKLDAIFFSPHKFLGGPGSSGILIFDRSLYDNHFSPDQPGGGTVKWTNPWGEHSYYEDVELREDGGTPPFMQTIKASLAIKLKEKIGVNNIFAREKEITKKIFSRLKDIPNLHLLAENIEERLPVIAFYIDDLHYNLGVKLLNDRFGIQMRGGCSCAGTYGHYLLHVSKRKSKLITKMIEHDDLSAKPGWIRMSLHPVMRDDEIENILSAIEELTVKHKEWARDYDYDPHDNNFIHKSKPRFERILVDDWFEE